MASTTEGSREDAPFREIPRVECERLLGEHTVGRVAWNAPDGPELVPVNYAYYNRTIVFRTLPHGVLSQLARRTNVAFEIDGVDENTRTGWSVVVRGAADRVMQDFDLIELWTKAGPVPWAAGNRTLHISINPRTITGREVVAR